MPLADAGSTHPSLLKSLADWDDHRAWHKLRVRYEGHLKRCCATFRLDANAADEVCQNTWVQVANRIGSFAYDPNGSFRGWLWNVCRFEVLRYLDARRKLPFFTLDGRDEWAASDPDPADSAAGPDDPLGDLTRAAEEIQARVRRNVAPHTWEAFWLVTVCFWIPKEAAMYLGMSQASVHKANQRVLRKLREEGRIHRGEMTTLE
jgi:RNA polymerase sigma factor (sigma-70 family)